MVAEGRTPLNDALLWNAFMQTQHTRLLLDCGYSGLLLTKPSQVDHMTQERWSGSLK